MNFQNLPDNWPTIPLTNPDHIADVLDMFVGRRDRMVGSLLILICDEERRPMQPVMINDIDAGWPDDDHVPLSRIAQQVADLRPEATVLCAIARQGRTRASRTDQRWAQSLEKAFSGRVELIGVHLVTPDGTVPIRADVEDAA